MPAIDVTEDAEAFKLTAELPGMTETEIDVAVSDNRLTLKGEKRQERDQQEKGRHVSERAYGMFERSFTLPDTVDADRIAAAFTNGVLTVTLPKKPNTQAAPKKIDVKAGG